MKKFALLGIATCVAIGLLNTKAHAEEANVEAIMKAHIDALGGMEALDKIRTIQRSGSASLGNPADRMYPGTYDEVIVIGEKFYWKIDVGILVTKSVWNGTEAWEDEQPRAGRVTEVNDGFLEFLKAMTNVSALVTV